MAPTQQSALRPVKNQNVDRQLLLRYRQKPQTHRERANTDAVSCVRTPPIVLPIAAPTGAPAANVANAIDRVRDGGKVCARMPSCARRNA